MKANVKILLPALGGAILVAGSAWLFFNDRSSEGETDGQALVSRRSEKKVGGAHGVGREPLRARHPLRRLLRCSYEQRRIDGGQAVRAAVQVKPAFDIGKDEEIRLSEAQRKLIAEIRAALRADDHRTLMKLVRQMQASKEWPDGIPKAVALGFADKDEEIRLANEHHRQADFITGLSDDYDAVFFVRLTDDYIDSVRISDQ